MSCIQNISLITVPLSIVLTTLSIVLPYWWSTETFIVGFWRAYYHHTWIIIDPQLDSQPGRKERQTNPQRECRLLYSLQLLSFFTVVLTDLSIILWLIDLIRREYKYLISLICTMITCWFLMAILLVLTFYTTTLNSTAIQIRLSYSFYLACSVLLLHSLTIVSLTIKFCIYRTSRRFITPSGISQLTTLDKTKLAFIDV
ncbi:unnamed protein product [Didymodactylos carnosus]|uniref:Uncharacterized protein n=1 Tax=Didymodactylos carnosus TaxID=1234261 RepID=A0A815M3N4_9BILA|nr:unnamed protein product [Didymodactylos carnosus]CAF4301994.1 unnamed protein product [Didymodactylos carnosus]